MLLIYRRSDTAASDRIAIIDTDVAGAFDTSSSSSVDVPLHNDVRNSDGLIGCPKIRDEASTAATSLSWADPLWHNLSCLGIRAMHEPNWPELIDCMQLVCSIVMNTERYEMTKLDETISGSETTS
uniref:Uncharacterized protein n=1 Tax=Spongospora subterranea TaxID=70186 RepID=A0A0H5RE66_9EUKA|eukprot:CRZ12434.1 hypothetical protein [Spongospora subterranea]